MHPGSGLTAVRNHLALIDRSIANPVRSWNSVRSWNPVRSWNSGYSKLARMTHRNQDWIQTSPIHQLTALCLLSLPRIGSGIDQMIDWLIDWNPERHCSRTIGSMMFDRLMFLVTYRFFG